MRDKKFIPLDTTATTASFNIFNYLWKKDRNGNSCPGILIPDTLVVNNKKQLLFFSSKSSKNNRQILKKKYSNGEKVYDKTTVRKRFCKRQLETSVIHNLDTTNQNGKYWHYRDRLKKLKKTRVVCKLTWEDSGILKFKYLDKKQLNKFIDEQWKEGEEDEEQQEEEEEGKETRQIVADKTNSQFINQDMNPSLHKFDSFILQRFVESNSNNNTVVKATWSPSACYINACKNKNNLEDYEIDLQDRAMTYDGQNNNDERLTAENIVKSKNLVNRIMLCCRDIAKHVQKHSAKYVEVCKMIIYFKVASSGELYLLWASDFKCSNMRASKRFFQSLMTSSKRKKSRRSVVPINTNNGAEPTLLELWGEDTNDSWDDIDPIKKNTSKFSSTMFKKKSITLNNFKDNLLSKDKKQSKSTNNIWQIGSSNDKDQKNENKIGSLQNLLKEIKHKEEDKSKFHCPVETCNRVESLHVRPSEATIKDIVDFYKSGFKIHQNLHSWDLEEVAMLGVAPLFGPRVAPKGEIPLVLANYVPGKSKRRYDLLCRDPTFMYRTIRVCSRCSSLFLKRAKLSLKNQVAANDIFKDQIKNRVTTAKVIRKYSGPVYPVKNKTIDRLATAKYRREKFTTDERQSQAKVKGGKKQRKKRPKSAGPMRRRKKRDKPKFDVPQFVIPPELPKSLIGWEPPQEWKDILQKKIEAEEEKEKNEKSKHYSIYSKEKPAVTTYRKRGTRPKRPQSAPMSRNRKPVKMVAAIDEKAKKMIEKQFKIYGVKSYSELKTSGIATKRSLSKKREKIVTKEKASTLRKSNNGKKLKKQRPQSASSSRNTKSGIKIKAKKKKKQRPSSASTSRGKSGGSKGTTSNLVLVANEDNMENDEISNMKVIEQTYSYNKHMAFIQEAKSRTPPAKKRSNITVTKSEEGKDNVVQSPVPLNLNALSPSYGEKMLNQNLTNYANEGNEVFV